MRVNHDFKPIYDINSKVIILGSMPSVVSREKHFYYANKTNRFWPIMERLFNVSLCDEEEKKDFLLNHHIALWDVIKTCTINSSSDASIKDAEINEIEPLIEKTSIQAIFCTGKTAYNLFIKHFTLDIPIFYLPSPSSANAAQSLDKLVEAYQVIKDYL